MNSSSEHVFGSHLALIPHNLDIEQALLGLMMVDNQSLEMLDEFLLSEHFYHPVHQTIYTAMVKMIHKGHMANPLTIWAALGQDEGLKALGGNAYLISLGEFLGAPTQILTYGRLVYELFLRRHLIHVGLEIKKRAEMDWKEVGDAMLQIEEAEKSLFLLTDNRLYKNSVSLSSAMDRAIAMAEKAYKRSSHVVGVTTGLQDLDQKIGGLHASDLIIVAGRPSMGKSALAMNIAFSAAGMYLSSKKKEGAAVAVFSLEMSSEQLALRILAQETGISSDRIRRGAITHDDFPNFLEVSRTLEDLPLWVDDTPSLSFQALRSRARRMQRRYGIGLVIIDYLQLLSSGGGKNAAENRVQELSEITRGLKALAKELHIPVVALSQLSRAVELREDKRPQLADLRESGSIEQDADVVMFVYREEYYVARKKPSEGSDKIIAWQKEMESIHNKAEIILAKQRHGPIGIVPVRFDSQRTKFSNYQSEYDDDGYHL